MQILPPLLEYSIFSEITGFSPSEEGTKRNTWHPEMSLDDTEKGYAIESMS